MKKDESLVIKCSNCDTDLVKIYCKNPDVDLDWVFVVHCDACGDSSFQTPVHGMIKWCGTKHMDLKNVVTKSDYIEVFTKVRTGEIYEDD